MTDTLQNMEYNVFAQKCNISNWEIEYLSLGYVAEILAFVDDFFLILLNSFICLLFRAQVKCSLFILNPFSAM